MTHHSRLETLPPNHESRGGIAQLPADSEEITIQSVVGDVQSGSFLNGNAEYLMESPPNQTDIPADDNGDARQLSSPSLVSGLRRGDPSAWERFFRLWGNTLLMYFQRSGLSLQDAEEVSQNVLSKIYRGIDGFQRDGKSLRLRFWVFDIARKELFSHRERYLSKPHSLGGSDFLRVSQQQISPDQADESSSQASFESVLMSNILRKIESDFEPHVWKAFWRYVVEERTGPEVAAELGMQANSVRQAVHRVKKRIQLERDSFPTD